MSDSRRVIVIGSGPCGAAAAYELVRQGVPVTLLESGSRVTGGLLVRVNGHNLFRRVPEMETLSGSRHVSTGDPKTLWFANLAPGGLSNQWTGAVPRFAPEDFDEGARLHEKYRWPITYGDLETYYERVERLIAISGSPKSVPNLPAGRCSYPADLPSDWAKVAEHAARHGQGMAMLPLADGPPFLFVRRGTAFNSYWTLIRAIERSPYFQMIMGAHALRLEWSGDKRRITGVTYFDRKRNVEERIEGSAVIVACGPLSSTCLLFNSAGADFPRGIGNEDGVLGKYLHDHPREWWALDLDRPIDVPSPAVYLTRLPHSSSPPLLATSWTIGRTSFTDKVKSLLPMKTASVGVQVLGTMIPEEQYYVRPADEKDEFGGSKLDICVRFDEETLCNTIKARTRLVGLLEEAGYKATLREVAPQLYPGTSVHYGGTIRMHADRQYGVLDAWNRVHGIPNLLVTDASCFTTGSEKNPTLTAMAIAVRAADRLANELKSGA